MAMLTVADVLPNVQLRSVRGDGSPSNQLAVGQRVAGVRERLQSVAGVRRVAFCRELSRNTANQDMFESSSIE